MDKYTQIYSHRGNVLESRLLENENTMLSIETVLKQYKLDGVEIDVWKFGNDVYLGHDTPKNKIHQHQLFTYKDYLLCHAKNFVALEWCLAEEFDCFYQYRDYFTISSKGKLIISPLYFNANTKDDTLYKKNSCMLMCPEKISYFDLKLHEISALNVNFICTDYPLNWAKYLRS